MKKETFRYPFSDLSAANCVTIDSVHHGAEQLTNNVETDTGNSELSTVVVVDDSSCIVEVNTLRLLIIKLFVKRLCHARLEFKLCSHALCVEELIMVCVCAYPIIFIKRSVVNVGRL